MTTFTILGTTCHCFTREEIFAAIEAGVEPIRISTPNPEHILEAEKNPAFRAAVQGMTHHILDGFGLYCAYKLGHPFGTVDHYPGADLVTDLFSRYAGSKTFYFLGGLGEEMAVAKATVEATFPCIRIVGAESGGVVDRNNPTTDPELAARITAAKPDIVLVGFGAPRQELWIHTAAKSINVPVMIGIGGALGFFGSKPRAPHYIRTLKLEAFYRALTQKGHWRRLWNAVVIFPLRTAGWYLGIIR